MQEQAQYAIEQMEAAKKAASDREEMNRILQLKNQELQQKLVRYDALKEAEKQAQKEAAKGNRKKKSRMLRMRFAISIQSCGKPLVQP